MTKMRTRVKSRDFEWYCRSPIPEQRNSQFEIRSAKNWQILLRYCWRFIYDSASGTPVRPILSKKLVARDSTSRFQTQEEEGGLQLLTDTERRILLICQRLSS